MIQELHHDRSVFLLVAAICASFALSGCVHRAAATIRNDGTMISGHNTAHMSLSDARKTVLTEAAAITVDHGYRLFEIKTPIRPGANVVVRLYGAGDIDPHAAGVYDADAIAAGKLP